MEVDENQQVCKFQRISSNNTTREKFSTPQKLITTRPNLDQHGWPSSRIVRVSRASGGKDRHSKVLTSKGLRDRRVRLSVGTAIQFYDLQDRLGYDQPSKAVEWLLKAASNSIDELPFLDIPIPGTISDQQVYENKSTKSTYQQQSSQAKSKSPSCSSTSETSKGSGLSLSRSENRMKARERARELTWKKEKEKETDSNQQRVVTGLNRMNSLSQNSSFTDLLTGGINNTNNNNRSPLEYYFNRPQQQLYQIPQFNINIGDKNNNNNIDNNLHHFSFLQDSYLQAVNGRGEMHNFSFSIPQSSSGGFTRGTLQSNLPSSFLPHHQRFQSSSIDGSTNVPFFIVPNTTVDHFPITTGGYHLSYEDGSGRHLDHHKENAKN